MPEAAEMLAIQALGFIAEDSERLAGFLASTGIPAEEIRSRRASLAFSSACSSICSAMRVC